MTHTLESVRLLIREATQKQFQEQLDRRSVKLLSLMQNGHIPKTSEELLHMSTLTEREAAMSDAKFASLLWNISGGKIRGVISPTRLVKQLAWQRN